MGLQFDRAELRRQMALRGLSGSDLAELGGISAASVSHALAGRPVSPATFRKICSALSARPELAAGVALLSGE